MNDYDLMDTIENCRQYCASLLDRIRSGDLPDDVGMDAARREAARVCAAIDEYLSRPDVSPAGCSRLGDGEDMLRRQLQTLESEFSELKETRRRSFDPADRPRRKKRPAPEVQNAAEQKAADKTADSMAADDPALLNALAEQEEMALSQR